MSEPYRDDYYDGPAPDPARYADDDLAHQAPYFITYCEECGENTSHGDFTDEYGSNRVVACLACRRVWGGVQ
jgi:hypothetical protein